MELRKTEAANTPSSSSVDQRCSGFPDAQICEDLSWTFSWLTSNAASARASGLAMMMIKRNNKNTIFSFYIDVL